MEVTLRRLLAMLPLGLLSATAWAMPKNNIPGDWAADQAKAAEWWLLMPHTWSIVLAVLCVLLAGFVTWYGMQHPRSAPPQAPDDMDPLKHKLVLWAVIAGLVVFYAPGLAGDFSIYDDPQNIWLDDRITEFTWEHVRGVLLENHRGVNQEWMFFSFQLNWLAAGKHYPSWYATNLAFFPLILLLIHRMAYKLSGSRWVGLLAVPFFGLSPIVAEILCWMMTRGHYFGMLFALSSLVAYLEYVDRRGTGWKQWGFLALSVLAFAGSQMGKPIYLYVPVWIVLFDLWFRRRDWLRAGLEKLPFAVVGLLFLRKIVEAGGERNRIADEWIGGSFVNTLALNANHFLEYLRSSYMPHQSGLRIPWNEPASWLYVTGVPNIFVFGFSPLASAIILLSLLVIAAVLAWRLRWGYLLLGLLASVVTFLPVANIPTHTVVAAYRYTFSANVMAALVLAAATVHLLGSARPLHRHRRTLVPALVAAWMMLSGYHANANRAAWRAPVDLWTRDARVLYPYDGWSHYYAGKTLNKTYRHHEAAAHLELAQVYLPQNDMVYRRLGDTYYYLGVHRKAEEYYREYFAHNRHRVNDYFGKRLVSLGLDDLVPDKHRP